METKTIAVDFGLSDIYPKIEAGLAGLEIGVLGRCSFGLAFVTVCLCIPLVPTLHYPLFTLSTKH